MIFTPQFLKSNIITYSLRISPPHREKFWVGNCTAYQPTRETELCSSTGHAAMQAHRSVHSTRSSHRGASYRTLAAHFMDGCSRLLELVLYYFNFCHRKLCYVGDEFRNRELNIVCEIIINGSPPTPSPFLLMNNISNYICLFYP